MIRSFAIVVISAFPPSDLCVSLRVLIGSAIAACFPFHALPRHLRADPNQLGKGTGKGSYQGKGTSRVEDEQRDDDRDDDRERRREEKAANRRKGRGVTAPILIFSHVP